MVTHGTVGKMLLLSLPTLVVVLIAVLWVQSRDANVRGTRATPDDAIGTPDRRTAENSINDLIADAEPGDVVTVPGDRVYRETVTIDKPITLVAEDGAEIRGSDIWSEWNDGFTGWRSERSYPELPTEDRWICEEGTGEGCLHPEQVYVDGRQLTRVRVFPDEGEFMLDGERHVVLGENPAGKIVEVTVRDRWISGRSADVTIRGFEMRHSANTGIKNERHDRWRVIDNELAYAHTVNVSLTQGPGMVISGNDIHHAGQLGISSYKAEIEIIDNRVYDNNTASFKTGWEAGGMKLSAAIDALVENNEVFRNDSMGIWTDVATSGPQEIVIRDNRVYDQPRQGIRVEISKNVRVMENVVYDNGRGYRSGNMNGAGITLSGTYDAEVSDNLLYDNNSGIIVVNVDRELGFDTVHDVSVYSNDVIQSGGTAVAWLQAYQNGDIFEPDSNNSGGENRYYYPPGADTGERFRWERYYGDLDAYNETPAERDGQYLTERQKETLLRRNDLSS